MKKLTKRERLIQEKVDLVKLHELTEAIGLLKEVKATKFDETVEVALRLGVDPRKADQMVRGHLPQAVCRSCSAHPSGCWP